jgi:hypothetical protein
MLRTEGNGECDAEGAWCRSRATVPVIRDVKLADSRVGTLEIGPQRDDEFMDVSRS